MLGKRVAAVVAVTGALAFVVVAVLYLVVAVTLVLILRAMSRRFRAAGEAQRDDDAPYGPRPTPPETRRRREKAPVS